VPGLPKVAHRPGAGGRFASSEGVETHNCLTWAVLCVLHRSRERHFSRYRQECTAELSLTQSEHDMPLHALCRALEEVRVMLGFGYMKGLHTDPFPLRLLRLLRLLTPQAPALGFATFAVRVSRFLMPQVAMSPSRPSTRSSGHRPPAGAPRSRVEAE
jgi:hypothetical protein